MNLINELFYQKNLKSITNKFEKAADWIREQPEVNWLKVFKNDDDSYNFAIKLSSNESPAYSSAGIEEDVQEYIKNLTFHKEDITIIVGVGLGHVLKAILEKKDEKHIVVVIEPVGHLLQLALSNYDFSKWIDDATLIPITQGKTEISATFSIFESQFVVENWNLLFEKYVNLRLNDYSEMANYTIEVLNQIRCNVGTVMNVGNILADNDISNIPYVIRYRGINEIKDLFKGLPAVMVSTGPSLLKNIHLLKEVQDKVIIVAVAQALRPLLAYDITPDFICTVDFGAPNLGHLKGLMCSNVPLVCLNRTYAPLIKSYQGPKFIVNTPHPGYEKTAAGVLESKGTLDQGGSVAHMCLALSYHLGCDPIMLTGQDLALGETSHTPLADVAGKVTVENGMLIWEVKDQRSHLSMGKHSMGEVKYIPGYFGKDVITNIGLASFITAFETLAERYKDRKIINCTEGGANIQGMKKSSLRKALDENLKDKIDKTILQPYLSLSEKGDELISQSIPALKTDIENLDNIIKYTKSGLETCEKMLKMIDQDLKGNRLKKMHELLKLNHDYSTEACKYTIFNPLVSLVIYSASRRIQSHEVNVTSKVDELLKDRKLLRTRLDRNKLILDAALKAAETLKAPYNETLKLLEEYDRTKDGKLLTNTEDEPTSITDAEQYFENGNFAHPYVDAKKILEEDPENEYAKEVLNRAILLREAKIKEMEEMNQNTDLVLSYDECLVQSRKSGMNGDYDNALWSLEEADRLRPGQEEVLWGLATTYYFIKNLSMAISNYQKLILKAPENYKYKFEYGQVLIANNQVQEGLKMVGVAMGKTQEFNYFYEKIGDLYANSNMNKEAIVAYEEFLRFFPMAIKAIEKIITCYDKQGNHQKVCEFKTKLEEIEKAIK